MYTILPYFLIINYTKVIRIHGHTDLPKLQMFGQFPVSYNNEQSDKDGRRIISNVHWLYLGL